MLRTVLPLTIIAIVIIGATSVAPMFVPDLRLAFGYVPVAATGLIGIAVLTSLATIVRAWTIRYQLGETEIRFRSGILTRTAISLPYARVQTVTTHNGVIERLLNITNLVCQSAADQSNITIPGLDEPAADRLRVVVLERARAASSTPNSL
ncbi:PH domain-containing protein [Herbiconiux liangxiaofengii]|uniref:PH domain-containing protein n=1 Tax=Herbiconiux liangxiaofengii TaxID=3342795 RepID=UPI0035B71A34